MSNRAARRPDFAKNLRLAVAGTMAFAIPIVVGVLNAPAIEAQVSTSVPSVPAPQTADKPLSFDAASVKAVDPPVAAAGRGDGSVATKNKGDGVRAGGGPGTSDPGRIHYPRISLKALLMKAYGLEYEDQIQGPGWLGAEAFAIDATMPPETTKAQFGLMLQNLLVNRFKLAIHRGTKEFPGYALLVAKGGVKMKESAAVRASQGSGAPDQPARPLPLSAMPHDSYGLFVSSPDPKLAGGRAGTSSQMNSRAWRLWGQQQTMRDLANILPNWAHLDGPVTDATALSSRYDFTLTFLPEGPTAPSATDPDGLPKAPDIFHALQTQLGLKLEPRKVPLDLIVVDHVEKTPTEND